jgi:hypothetical protein
MDVNHGAFPGVALELGSKYSATTDADGNYLLAGLLPEPLVLTPHLQSYAFVPVSRAIRIPLPDNQQENFIVLPGPVSATLAPSGALWLPYTLTYTDTQGLPTHMRFPLDSLEGATRLVVTPTLVTGAPGWAFARHAFELAAYREDELQPAPTFDRPVTVTLQYSDMDISVILDEEELALFWWDGTTWLDATDTCSTIPAIPSHDLDDNVLRTPVCRAGLYALLGPVRQLYLPGIVR